MENPDRPGRPYLAFALSLLLTGLGHLALGHRRRAAGWFGLLLLGIAVGYLVAGLASPWLWWSVLVMLPVAHLLGALDTLRFPRPAALAPVRTVVAAALSMALALLLLVAGGKRLVVECFLVPSAAMYPTLVTGDQVMASKVQGRLVRGDVVAFRAPFADEVAYLKRIVAVGGDRVETRKGVLWINDRPVARKDTGRICQALGPTAPCRIWEETLGGHSYLVATRADTPTSSRRVVVPPDHVYVLGDNRDRSADSRHYGAIPVHRLVGQSRFIWWSSDRTGVRWARLNDVIE